MSDTDRVVDEIRAERKRQQSQEGWTPDHDDTHHKGELTRAALNYAAAASICMTLDAKSLSPDEPPPIDFMGSPFRWPWEPESWKPKGVRRDLVRAAALIVAEIERLDRATVARMAEKMQPKTCSHPACWGPCGTCGAHVHENEHGRLCPNCGKV